MTDVTQEQIEDLKVETNTKIEDFALGVAEDNVKVLKSQWGVLLGSILERMGNTPENQEWLNQQTQLLQVSSFLTTYNAVQLTEMFNYYINGQQPIDVGALFMMNDLVRGVKNHAAAYPQNLLNVYDPELAGSDDPRWSYDELPTEKLMTNPGNIRIPIKVETFTELAYGYLELFAYSKQVGDKTVKIQTTLPAIRIKDNYIVPNAVFRWFEIDEETVKNAWNTGRSQQRKNTDYITKGKEANPIEDTATTGQEENGTTQES